jgi:hypothetical protein
VLEAGGGLDRRDDLPRDAELGEAPERRLLVGPEVPHRLVETDQALLVQVVGLPAGEEVRARLQPDEARVAADERVHGRRVAVSGTHDELEVGELSLASFLSGAGGSGLAAGHGVSSWDRRPERPEGGLSTTLTLKLRSRS